MSEKLLVSFIKQLANDLELEEPLEADGHGFYTIAFSKSIHVSIRALETGFYFVAVLGECPARNCEEFFIFAMQSNLFGIGTGGGVIGLNDEGKLLTLTLISPYQMSYRQFKEHVEDFVNWVDLWQKKVHDAQINVA